jgi:hypothetical protein
MREWKVQGYPQTSWKELEDSLNELASQGFSINSITDLGTFARIVAFRDERDSTEVIKCNTCKGEVQKRFTRQGTCIDCLDKYVDQYMVQMKKMKAQGGYLAEDIEDCKKTIEQIQMHCRSGDADTDWYPSIKHINQLAIEAKFHLMGKDKDGNPKTAAPVGPSGAVKAIQDAKAAEAEEDEKVLEQLEGLEDLEGVGCGSEVSATGE